MAKYTENFNLIKPEDDEYYDVADFNENMDIIDEALAESAGGSDKIGEPGDRTTATVFGKLNGFISPDGQGTRIIKSIQRFDVSLSSKGSSSYETYTHTINPVVPSRCIVLMERMKEPGEGITSVTFVLNSNNIVFEYYLGTNALVKLCMQVIEFY